MNSQSVTVAYTRSSFWKMIEGGSMAVVGLIAFLLMARFLSPEEMGRAALAITTLSLLRLLAMPGYSVYIWQSSDDEVLEMSVFWASLFSALLLCTLCIGCVVIFGESLGWGDYRGGIVGAALLVFPSVFKLIPHALMFRRFEQRRLFVGTLLANLIGAAFGIVGAYRGIGEWAILLKVLVTEVVLLFYLFFVTRWYPKLVFNIHRMVECLRFCVSIQASQVLEFAQTRWVDFLLASFWSPAALGYYYLARRIVEQVGRVTIDAVSEVSFPAFSQLRHGRNTISEFLLERSSFHASLFLPAYLIGIFWAGDLIQLVFGNQWTAATPIFQVLLGVKVIYLLVHLCPALLITHRYEKLRLYLFGFATVIYMVVLLASYESSLVMVAFAQTVGVLCYSIGLLIALKLVFKLQIREYLGAQFRQSLYVLLALCVLGVMPLFWGAGYSFFYLVLSVGILLFHYWPLCRSREFLMIYE